MWLAGMKDPQRRRSEDKLVGALGLLPHRTELEPPGMPGNTMTSVNLTVFKQPGYWGLLQKPHGFAWRTFTHTLFPQENPVPCPGADGSRVQASCPGGCTAHSRAKDTWRQLGAEVLGFQPLGFLPWERGRVAPMAEPRPTRAKLPHRRELSAQNLTHL